MIANRLYSHCQKLIGWPVNKDKIPYNPLALFNMVIPSITSTPINNGISPRNFLMNRFYVSNSQQDINTHTHTHARALCNTYKWQQMVDIGWKCHLSWFGKD